MSPRAILLILLLGSSLNGCAEDKPSDVDATPPNQIVNLAGELVAVHDVVLRWTAPGDDGQSGQASNYEIRYALGSLTDATFDSAFVLTPSSVPRLSGNAESTTITELGFGDWRFAVKSEDEAGNRSPLSNVVSVTIRDNLPPGTIDDLTIVSQLLNVATLRWTAPGDDGVVGSVASYSLRRAYEVIDEDSWEQAIEVGGVPAPDSSGSQQSADVQDLDPRRTEYFAIRSLDPHGNWSELSNVVNSTPSDFERLTMSGQYEGAFAPDVSPDGSHIAFHAYWKSMYPQIYVMTSEGSNIEQITAGILGASTPKWSPDGSMLAFIMWTANGDSIRYELCTIDRFSGEKPEVLVSHYPDAAFDPAWSPDGSKLLYCVRPGDNFFGPSELYVVDAAGGTPVLLESDNSRNRSPAWSPNGAEIVFQSDRSGDDELWLIPAGGGAATVVTTGVPFVDGSPSWSPDGQSIVFTSERTGTQDLWIISRDGSGEAQLTFEPEDQGDADWSPSGEYIAFTWVGADRADIWAIRGNFANLNRRLAASSR